METQSYLTNLSDAEWHLLEPLLPPPARHRAAATPPRAHHRERSPVPAALGLRLAPAARGLAAVEDGLPLLPEVAAGWHLGTDPAPAAPATPHPTGARPRAERRLRQQPVGQDDRRRRR